MSDEPYDLADLRERARGRHVVVIGGGIGGLVAALEIAELGIGVTVLEQADRPGGAIRSAELAGLALDLGAESFATRGGHVARLIDQLGLTDQVVDPGTGAGGAWVAGVPGVGAAPLPAGGVLGIPSNPFADDVRRVIGWRGVWRAYLDRLRPVLRIGHASSLGELVTSRMGRRVHDRLVAPVTTGVYSAAADRIDPDVAAPGLNEAITRVGSLSGAVAALVGERKTAPGGAVRGIRGGMGRLVDALVERIEELGGVVRTGVRATAIEPGGDAEELGDEGRGERSRDEVAEAAQAHGAEPARDERAGATGARGDDIAGATGHVATGPAWRVRLAAGTDGADSTAPPSREARDTASETDADPADVDADAHPAVSDAAADALPADAVIVATEEGAARRLLAPHAAGLAQDPPAPGPAVAVVTLVVNDPRLDAAPRGTGVLTVPGSHRAKALTHTTAKWGWVAEQAGSGVHAIRVSFGSAAEPPAIDGLSDDDAIALALEEASALLGVPLDGHALAGARIERFAQSQPASTIGQAEQTRRARRAIRAVPSLGAVGAWLSGTGLAQVVPDARTEAERIRRTVLFADSDG